jgi:hypothetical protein
MPTVGKQLREAVRVFLVGIERRDRLQRATSREVRFAGAVNSTLSEPQLAPRLFGTFDAMVTAGPPSTPIRFQTPPTK